jgi:hypothetical protein
VECDDIMPSHDLWLDVACDFTYATNEILVVHVGCNLILVANYNKKIETFLLVNDGIWWMVQWGPYNIHYHIKLQTMSSNPRDECIKQEVINVPKWLTSECLHCGWCKGGNI